MKKLLFLLTLASTGFSMNAQPVTTKTLKKTITLIMPRTADDEMPGTRGASVAWHPLQKKYYAAMAGNVSYPLGVYDVTGKKLSDDSLNCGEDIRGLWYNPQQKQLQGNCYGDYGWYNYTLDPKGIPTDVSIFLEGMNQPDVQSVGNYSMTNQQVLFLKYGQVLFYTIKDGALVDSVQIHWGRTRAEGAGDDEMETPEDYNYTTVVYPGTKSAELGLLNITQMEVELYNAATGFLTSRLKFPEDAPMNASFNFAYANGMYWLFNIEERTWTGYK